MAEPVGESASETGERAPLQAVDPNAPGNGDGKAPHKTSKGTGAQPDSMETEQEGKDAAEDNTLTTVLGECGIRFDAEKNNATLSKGAGTGKCLVRLQSILDRAPARAEDLLQDLESYVMQNGKEGLACLLRPLGDGECIIKMLLNVQCTQTRVMRTLFQWVVEYAADEETSEAERLQQDLPRSLLFQLRFLNFIENGEELAADLMECLSSVCQVSPESKRLPREIVNIIPEVLEDAQHGTVVVHLKQILEEERELTVPIIETLSNLRIPEKDMEELRSTVLQILGSAPFGDLPVAIQFLLESLGTGTDSATKRCKTEVMQDLRQRFAQICNEDIVHEEPSASQESYDVTNVGGGSDGKGGLGQSASTALQANNILAILQVLMRCLVARKDLCKTYLETIDGAVGGGGSEEGLSVIDMWILVGLRAHAHYRRKITTLLRQHVTKTMAVDVNLVRASVRGHRDVLDTQFKHFLDLAGTFLSEDGLSVRQRNDGVSLHRLRDVGRALYVSLFREFTEPYYRQELVVALVMHCGVSSEETAELEGALECMLDLTHKRRYVQALEPFIEFIKTLIHSAPQMQLRHCRMVFSILSSFVVHRSNTEAGGAAWFHVLLRKLLTNPSESSRRAGAIGAVQFINAHARESSPEAVAAGAAARFSLFDDDEQDEDDEDDNNDDHGKKANARGGEGASASSPRRNGVSQGSSSSGRFESECKDVFDLALSSSRSNARTMATLCDELGAMVEGPHGHLNKLAQPIALYMVEELNIEFMERFCTSMPGASSSVSSSSSSSSSSTSAKPTRLRLRCFTDLDAEPLYDENKGSNLVAINLLPNLAKGMQDPRLQERYLYLAPMLRGAMALAGVAGKREAMSALLGAPMLLGSEDACNTFFALPEADEDAERAQGAVCLSIYHAINWVRELINVSAEDMDDDEVKRKIFARFDLLEEMHNLLETLLQQAKSGAVFAMLPVQRSEATMLSIAPLASGSGSSGGKRASKDETGLPKDLSEVLRASYRPFRMQVFSLLDASAALKTHPHAARALLVSLLETVKLAMNPKRSFFGKRPKKGGAQGSARIETDPDELLEPLRARMPAMYALATSQFEELEHVEEDEEGAADLEPRKVLADCVLTNCKVLHEVARCPRSRTDRSFRSHVELVLAAFSSADLPSQEHDANDDSSAEDKASVAESKDKSQSTGDRPLLSEAVILVEKLLESESMSRTETKLSLVDLLVDLVPFVRSRGALEDRVSKQCSRLLRKGHADQNLTKATIGRLLDLHLRFDTQPLQRMEELIDDMASVAETPGSSGETFETLSIGTLPYFYEPVLRALLRGLDQLDFQSHLPQSKAAGGKRRGPEKGPKSRKGKVAKRRKRNNGEHGDEDDDDDDDDGGGDDDQDEEEEDEDQEDEDGESRAAEDSGAEDEAVSGRSANDLSPGAEDESVAPRRAPKKSVSATLDDAEALVDLIRKTILLTRMCPTKKTLLVMAVRQGRAIIERFMKIAMPFLARYFRQPANQNKIVRIFRGLQQSTRQLQSICDSAKSNKDLSLVSAVPKLRKILESLILAAKGLCQASGTLSAFTTGNLKRRNVDGSLRKDPVLEADDTE